MSAHRNLQLDRRRINVTDGFGNGAGNGDSSFISNAAENSNASNCNSSTPKPIPTQARGPRQTG